MRRFALLASLAFILAVTLRPVGGPNELVLAPWSARQLDSVNVVGNILLFAVPGALLSSIGWRIRRTVVAGFALSLAIELLQLVIPGRTTATTDVICNTLGAGAGWLVSARWRRGRAASSGA